MSRSRDGHRDPFADSGPTPYSPAPSSPLLPSNPLSYQQVGQASTPNLNPASPSPNGPDSRSPRFASSPLNPRPTGSSPSASGTSPPSSSGHGSSSRAPDRSLSQASTNSLSGIIEKDHPMRGVMAGNVGGGFSPYPVRSPAVCVF